MVVGWIGIVGGVLAGGGEQGFQIPGRGARPPTPLAVFICPPR
jgi:hypothetical protein